MPVPDLTPSTPNVVAQAPQIKVGAGAFERAPEFVPRTSDAQGIEQLGEGASNLAVPLAKQGGAQDAAASISRNPDGSMSVGDVSPIPIFGQAGLQYQDSLLAGQMAAGRSNVDQKMAEFAAANQNNPTGFRSVAGPYVDGLKAAGDPLSLHMADYAFGVASQHDTSIIANTHRTDLASNSAAIDGRVSQLENNLDGLAAQGGGSSPTFKAMTAERDALLAQKTGNPAYGYNQQQRDIDDSNFQQRLTIATFTGTARDEAQRTGNVAGALQTLDTQLKSLNLPPEKVIAYEGEVTRHLYAMSAVGAQQKQALSDQADALRTQSHAHPDSVTDDQLDSMSMTLERSRLFQKSAEVQEAKAYKNIISPMIVSGSVADAQNGLHQIQAMAANAVPGTSGRGLINAPYTKPVDQPAASGLSPQGLYSYLLGKGATKNEALLLTGAAGSEGVYNPQAVHDGGIGYGLFGHNGDRLAAMQAQSGTQTPSWQQQASFALKELRSRPEGAAANAATSADALTDAQMAYEQPRAYTAANPRAGENYTGRLNTIRNLASNLQDAPTITPGDPATGGFPGQPGAPLAMRYSVALKEAQDAYNKRGEQLWSGIQNAYDNKMQPTPSETAQIRAMAPDISDPALRQKINDGLTKAQVAQGMAPLPVAQQQDIAATLTTLGETGQLGNVQRRMVSTVQAQAEQQARLAQNDPVSLAVLKTGPQVAHDMNLPPLTPLDPSSVASFSAGLQARQVWKGVAKADPSVSNMPLRSTDIEAFKAQAPNWDGPTAANALGAMTNTLKPDELSAVMANSDMKTTIMGLAHSGDPAKMNAAYSLLDAQYRANPIQFQTEDGGKAMTELRSWQALLSFLPPQEVAKRMSEASDPNVIKAKEGLEATAAKNLESIDSSNIVRSVYGSHVPLLGTYVPFTAPGDIASDRAAQAAGALTADYKAAYTDMYKETGDATASDAFAKEKLANKYSVSGINGGKVMAWAPDREIADPNGAGQVGAYYPKVDGSFDWLKQQLRVDATNTDFFKSLHYSDRQQAANWSRSLSLIPDAKTEADIAAKRPPSYQVLGTGTDGRYHLLNGDDGRPMRFRGDPSTAQQAAAASFAQDRQDHEAGNELPDNLD